MDPPKERKNDKIKMKEKGEKDMHRMKVFRQLVAQKRDFYLLHFSEARASKDVLKETKIQTQEQHEGHRPRHPARSHTHTSFADIFVLAK